MTELNESGVRPTARQRSARRISAVLLAAVTGAAVLLTTQTASAVGTPVDLGTAASYSVLGGQSVTNTGPSLLNADLGVSPGTAISGFPPGLAAGATHVADAAALQAQADLVTAYNAAAGQAPDASIGAELGGQTLLPGVYNADSSTAITGTLTLDAQGDPNAVFIFQVGSALTTASDSSVALLNGARSCNVVWQIGSSATLGTNTAFVGSILALTSITANTGATVDGRALARNGSVTLDSNTFTGGSCATTPPTEEPTETPTEPPTDEPTDTPTDGPTVAPTETPTAGTPTDTPSGPTGPTPGEPSGSEPTPEQGITEGEETSAPPAYGMDRPDGDLPDTGAASLPLAAAAAAIIIAGIVLTTSAVRRNRLIKG